MNSRLRRGRPTRFDWALSLIELMLCVAMLAVLSGGAYMTYIDHTERAKETATRNNIETLRKALQVYNADHPVKYRWHDTQRLVGRYLEQEPMDGYGQDFLIDFVFNRVISRGQDGVLNTHLPFHVENPGAVASIVGDDVIASYGRNGRIAFVQGTALRIMDSDGSNAYSLVSADVGPYMDMGPGGGKILYVSASTVDELRLITMDQGFAGTDEVVDLSPWTPNAVEQIRWARDGVHYGLCLDIGGDYSVGIRATTTAAPPTMVTTFFGAMPGDRNGIAWSQKGTVMALSAAYRIYKSSVATGASTSVFLPNEGAVFMEMDWSPNNSRIAYVSTAGPVQVVEAVTGMAVTTCEPTAGLNDVRCPRFSPDSRCLAYIKNDVEIWVRFLEADDATGKFRVYSSSATIHAIAWN